MILKFDNDDARRKFVSLTQTSRGDIGTKLKSLRNRPYVVIEDLDREQADWVTSHVEPLGKAYDDVQFEPFEG